MKNLKLIQFTLFIIVLGYQNFAAGQDLMSYQEFHERYIPTNEKLIPNSDLIKSINQMSIETAASQIKNSTNSAYNGDKDDELTIAGVLTSCKRDHIANIIEHMEVYDAVRALKLLKNNWIKELVYFIDMQTYHELAPSLVSELYIPEPTGPFGPIINNWSPAYAGIFYDYSYSLMNGYNNILQSYGSNEKVNSLHGFGITGGFYLKQKEGKSVILDITYQNRTAKTNYESGGFVNSKFNSNTFGLNLMRLSGGTKFKYGTGWGVQVNMASIKTITATETKKVGGGINGGLSYNAAVYINPIKSIPVMLGLKAYAQINLPSYDFNPLYDELNNITVPSTNKKNKSSISTFGIQFQALYKFGKEYVKPVFKDFDIELAENHDKRLNTTYSEISPSISADGNTMYFIRTNHPMNTKGAEKSQDVWVSDISNGLSNAKAEHLENPFNKKTNNSVVGISPDGNSMMIKGRYGAGGKYQGLGFSKVHKTKNGWSELIPQEIEGYADMSKGKYISAQWTTDGKHIMISMSEKSKDDDQDMYVSHLNTNGTWSRPISLGKLVNTTNDENGPYLASDGKTLYFSSDRKGGEGNNDIWMSQRKDNSWDNWSKPVNLGPEVNTEGWDAYYTIDAQGKYAYMVTRENTIGEADIVRIKLKEEVQPDPVVLVTGFVLDQKTNEPVSARISYNGIDDNKNYGNANSDPNSGKYTIVLPYGVNYEFTASASNYIGVSDNLNLIKVGKYKVIKKDLVLVPIEVGATVRLNNIFFETGKSNLKTSSYAELDRVVNFLNTNQKVTIEISGHTDNVGAKKSNQLLSQKRAKAVTDYIINKGILNSRLTSVGYGFEKPLTENSTKKGRKLNRRVEFTILTNE